MGAQGLAPLVSSVAFWLVASLLVGWLANRLPMGLLDPHASPSQPGAGPPRFGSGSGAPGAPLGIRAWKRWIPDAGAALPGGVAKASLVCRDPAALRRLVLEINRAEFVHWILLSAWLITALWLPPAAVLINLVVAVVLNLPCLLLQRYNRARLQRCLTRMGG